MSLPSDWIVPHWPAPAHVRAACTTRGGGVSVGPYQSLNLGDHVGDAPPAVASNRNTFAQAIGARPVFLRQVHGCAVQQLMPEMADGAEADACLTAARGLACTIMVADCLPVLLTTRDGRVAAAAHAGWRGLAGDHAGGVLESVARELQEQAGASGAELLAWLGPCIGPDAFEVGGEVKAAFDTAAGDSGKFFRPYRAGKWLADLQGLARARLQTLGITAIFGNDGSPDWCTVSNRSRFFSHRRDGVSGRFAACVWLL